MNHVQKLETQETETNQLALHQESQHAPIRTPVTVELAEIDFKKRIKEYNTKIKIFN